jgi:hypothetical protein
MKHEIGKQYGLDNSFKKEARKHQSLYRAETLKVNFDEYGNRLMQKEGENHFNYFKGLGVIAEKLKRYPKYSKTRDADMLRSEHIPFNIFAPLKNNLDLTSSIFKTFEVLNVKKVVKIEIEYAPKDKKNHLGDATSFDAYVEFINKDEEICGIGIEVKYTEKAYPLKKDSAEYEKVNNKNSTYSEITNDSQKFVENVISEMKKDEFRQIWRNYILGLSMVKNKNLNHFYSMTLYPTGNKHFEMAIPEFQKFVKPEFQQEVFGVTFEDFFDKINLAILKLTNPEYKNWADYLVERYVVK